MSIKVTFEFETAASAAAFLMEFDSPPEGSIPATTGDKPRRGRPPKVTAPVDPTSTAPAPATPAPTAPAPAAPSVATAPATPSAAAVPFTALVEPLTKLADVDLDKAMSILGKFGVKKASELKPEQFGPLLAEVNAALAGPTKQSLI